MSVVIILTMTVNVNLNKSGVYQRNKTDRINTYVKSVTNWLHNTNFNIVIAENSGYDFKEEFKDFFENFNTRFEVVSYNEKKLRGSKLLKYLNTSLGAAVGLNVLGSFSGKTSLTGSDFGAT
jgi:hypothetical protein